MKLSEMKKESGESALLFGPPKTGKTLAAGQLAKYFNRVILFDLENGVQTLMTHLSKELQDKIEVVQIPDSRVNPVAVRTMLKVFTGQKVDICNKHGKVMCIDCAKDKSPVTTVELSKLTRDDVVIVDSLSQLSDSVYAHVMGQSRLNDLAKPEWDDWGQMGNLLAMILSQIQTTPYNIVFISHETMVEMPDKSMKLVPIAGTREFSKRVAKFFGHVVYFEVALGKFKQGSSPLYKMNVVAGSRSGLIIDGEKVTLGDLLKSGVKS